jgi:enediyne biosynthesis protein E4
MDLVAGNLGLNSKYKTPDAEHPMVTYYGVFDDSGKCQVVEVKREKNEMGDILYPERGRSCSSTAMPYIKLKFPTFRKFATASLTDVYSEEKLRAAEKFEANEFRSGAWMNQGSGKFEWKPFVREAQNAPVFGIAAADFTGDGKVDLFLAQNWIYGPQIETPRYDNGVGLLLKNDGEGGFLPLSPLESGIALTGCMKAVAVQDLNGDGKMDLVVTRNSAPTVVLEKQ